MDKITEFLLPIVQKINAYLSDYILIVLLIGVGLFYTIRTRFVQVRCFGEGMKKVFGNLSLKGGKQKSGLSSFQALATAIAAQVGTGNIVGACGAILIGGPGAIFLSGRSVNDSTLLQEGLYSLGGLCAVTEPLLCLLCVDLDFCGLGQGVVVTDLLNETTVSGRTAVCNDHAVEGSLLRTQSSQSHFYCHDLFPPKIILFFL